MVRRIERLGQSVILYDDSLLSQPQESLFEPASWPGAPAAPGYAGGRGQTLFIRRQDQDWVLRHYYRGGFMGRWLDDEFLWMGFSRSRPCREWDLLAALTRLQLPVPRPVAARARRNGLIYSADLITVLMPRVVPLSTRLAAGELPEQGWRDLGELLGRFHAAGVFHADLTAHNLQVDAAGRFSLLDFDRGRIMPAPGSWMQANLDRLQRSLRKISADTTVRFSGREWGWLEAGYRARLSVGT